MLNIFRANMQTSILVLAVILLGLISVALFLTHRDLRETKLLVSKNRYDIEALQSMLGEYGNALMSIPRYHKEKNTETISINNRTKTKLIPEQKSLSDQVLEASVETVNSSIGTYTTRL
jgi:hypothetical protein